VSELVSVLHGKWMFPIFVELKKGDSTFGALKKKLAPITNKVLTQHLRKAVNAGCVEQTAVGYVLLPKGEKVVRALRLFAKESECKACTGNAICLSTSS
jgi:DNA-binding HxlR family transcriptional regulator